MKREKISGVYGLHNKINNKWYIGVSIDIFKRWITGI
jgi:predicted GIY-YIG superfamily endonuclease